jgi:hypothetical protein
MLNQNLAPHLALRHADKALYYSKDNGRDQLSYYEQLVDNNLIAQEEIETDIELF